VATDHVGVSASDRISPVASAPVPSGPAIFLSAPARAAQERQADSYSSARTDRRRRIAAASSAVKKIPNEAAARELGLKRRALFSPLE
jgi:hypothetical protein